MSNIPILCYHNVGASPQASAFRLLYTSQEKFERQLWTMRRLGLCGVSIGDGLQRLGGHGGNHLVMLSFDDGYLDTFTAALPLLQKYGFTATCYVVSDAIGSYNRWDAGLLGETKPLMTHDHLQQWLAAGMEIGSHSCSHPRLRQLDSEAAQREIADSRAALRRAFGVEVDHFCYPYGSFAASTMELVRRAGYLSAVTVEPGIARATDDRFRLPRILVDGDSGWWKFVLQVATPFEQLRHRRRAG